MALTGGSVTKTGPKTFTGTGLAKAIFDRLKLSAEKKHQVYINLLKQKMHDPPQGQIEMGILNGADESLDARYDEAMSLANDLGAAIVDYIKANAEISISGAVATIDTSTHAGRVPSPATPGSPIDGPSAPVELPVTVSGGTVLLLTL